MKRRLLLLLALLPIPGCIQPIFPPPPPVAAPWIIALPPMPPSPPAAVEKIAPSAFTPPAARPPTAAPPAAAPPAEPSTAAPPLIAGPACSDLYQAAHDELTSLARAYVLGARLEPARLQELAHDFERVADDRRCTTPDLRAISLGEAGRLYLFAADPERAVLRLRQSRDAARDLAAWTRNLGDIADVVAACRTDEAGLRLLSGALLGELGGSPVTAVASYRSIIRTDGLCPALRAYAPTQLTQT